MKIAISIIAIVVVFALGYLLLSDNKSLADPNIAGTVTAYSPGPGPADEPTVFNVDGNSIYIGGDMTRSIVKSFDADIKKGDKVEAYTLKDENGYMTIVNCEECYVRKIK